MILLIKETQKPCEIRHQAPNQFYFLKEQRHPEALAPVGVLLSPSLYAYLASSVPLPGTSRFRRQAVYTECLRSAGAPRRPASGSLLSLHHPSRHCRPLRPRGVHRLRLPSSSPLALAFAESRPARHSQTPSSSASHEDRHFGAYWFAFAAACQVARLPGGSDRASPSQRRLLLPSFPRFGHPPRRRVSLRRQLSKSRRRDSHPLGHSASIAAPTLRRVLPRLSPWATLCAPMRPLGVRHKSWN